MRIAKFAKAPYPRDMDRMSPLHCGGYSNRRRLFLVHRISLKYVKFSANLIVFCHKKNGRSDCSVAWHKKLPVCSEIVQYTILRKLTLFIQAVQQIDNA